MSRIFDDIGHGPQTHALVIGIGGYPYLKDGASARAQNFREFDRLGQLTTAPRAALAFKDFLLAQKAQLCQPLGSIDLLLTTAPDDPDPEGNGAQYQGADLRSIKRAYYGWKQVCDQNADNVAIFFFAGHGLEKVDHYLLAEDFGEFPEDPWSGAFNIDKTREAFHTCRAETQCFFIDACRKVPKSALAYDFDVSALEPWNLLAQECANNLTLKSAAHNEAAYGPVGQPTFFTQALIRALRGGAAIDRGQGWTVHTGGIAPSIETILDQLLPPDKVSQDVDNSSRGSAPLLRLQAPPEVDLRIDLSPTPALAHAQLSCTNMDTQEVTDRPPTAEPWQHSVQAGYYQLDAAFAGGDYQNAVRRVMVAPPFIHSTLDVS